MMGGMQVCMHVMVTADVSVCKPVPARPHDLWVRAILCLANACRCRPGGLEKTDERVLASELILGIVYSISHVLF